MPGMSLSIRPIPHEGPDAVQNWNCWLSVNKDVGARIPPYGAREKYSAYAARIMPPERAALLTLTNAQFHALRVAKDYVQADTSARSVNLR